MYEGIRPKPVQMNSPLNGPTLNISHGVKYCTMYWKTGENFSCSKPSTKGRNKHDNFCFGASPEKMTKCTFSCWMH